MKKFTAVLFVTVLFFSFFNSSAYAHPGRTDSDGGHYDHSTGEYHYHNSGYSYNDREDEGLERIVAALSGELDGSFQKKYDLVYSTSRVKGYNDALKNFSLNTPIFNYLVQSNKLDYFVLSSYSISEARYEDTRSDYLYGYGFDYRSAKNKYIETYNNCYNSVVYVPESFKITPEGVEAYESGYSDGYASFDTFVSQYRKHSPIKAFFVLLKTYQIVLLSLLSFFVLSLIVFAIFSRKFSKNRSKVYDENISKPKTPQNSSSVNTNNNISKRKITPPKKLTLELSNIKLLPQYAESIIYPIGEEPEDVFRARYAGVPVSSFIKLPPSITHIDKHGRIYFNDKYSTYGDYSVYVSDSGRVLHKKRWCSNSWTELNYLCLPEKYKNFKKCQRCFDVISKYKIDKNDWLELYRKIILKKVEYGIDEIPILDIHPYFPSDLQHLLIKYELKKTYPTFKSKIITPSPKNTFLVGKDIPLNKTYFSPVDINKPAYINIITENKKEEYSFPVYKQNQYITLMYGEEIELVNCYFNRE